MIDMGWELLGLVKRVYLFEYFQQQFDWDASDLGWLFLESKMRHQPGATLQGPNLIQGYY